MLDVILSNRFRKDLKFAQKRGYDLSLLEKIVDKLSRCEELPARNRDHSLTGEYAGFANAIFCQTGFLFTE